LILTTYIGQEPLKHFSSPCLGMPCDLVFWDCTAVFRQILGSLFSKTTGSP